MRKREYQQRNKKGRYKVKSKAIPTNKEKLRGTISEQYTERWDFVRVVVSWASWKGFVKSSLYIALLCNNPATFDGKRYEMHVWCI